MRIDVLFTPAEITEAAVKGKTVAVIDVLRACTTIAFALSRGCSSIIPVASVEAATSLVASLDKNVTLLGGEREGKRMMRWVGWAVIRVPAGSCGGKAQCKESRETPAPPPGAVSPTGSAKRSRPGELREATPAARRTCAGCLAW